MQHNDYSDLKGKGEEIRYNGKIMVKFIDGNIVSSVPVQDSPNDPSDETTLIGIPGFTDYFSA